MKKAGYTGDQMARILREADKAPVAEVANRQCVSEAWRMHYNRVVLIRA